MIKLLIAILAAAGAMGVGIGVFHLVSYQILIPPVLVLLLCAAAMGSK
jgi:hypothetical protein